MSDDLLYFAEAMSRSLFILLLVCYLIGCTARQYGSLGGQAETPANRLVEVGNPYLQRHAHDPISWRRWSSETLAEAKRKNRPILVAVGFSASYWCQKMQEECYQDSFSAKLLNDAFIPVLIDREARPDVDAALMRQCEQRVSQPCGWPLHVMLTPDGDPVYMGTYYDRGAWISLLQRFRGMFRDQPEEVAALAEAFQEVNPSVLEPPDTLPHRTDLIPDALELLHGQVDPWRGGLLGKPKFPRSDVAHLLLYDVALRNDNRSRELLKLTLDHMADGAIYDQIGGGFFRHTTDEAWLHPQFEKMLYDQAQLATIYARAYQLTKNPRYERIVYETLAMVEGMFQGDASGYYSSLAADSEGEFGRYYLWPRIELDGILGAEAVIFAQYFNLTDEGNWGKGQSIPYRTLRDETWANAYRLNLPEFQERITRMREKVQAYRSRRLLPRMDRKQITGWNALLTSAWTAAYQAMGDTDFLRRAEEGGEYLIRACQRDDGGLVRYLVGGEGIGAGFLSDYAYAAQAMLDLYQVTVDPRWIDAAEDLVSYGITHFYDEAQQGFHFVEVAHTPVAPGPDPWPTDYALPNPDMSFVRVLLTLHRLRDEPLYRQVATRLLHQRVSRIWTEPRQHIDQLRMLIAEEQPHHHLLLPDSVSTSDWQQLHQEFLPQLTLIEGTQADAWWQVRGEAPPLGGWWLCGERGCDSLESVDAVLARFTRSEE